MNSLAPQTELLDRIHGCWLGKSIGGTLGLPAEGRMERLYLTYYDPVPTIAPPNDDLELQLVWLDLVEKCRGSLGREHFTQAWLDHIHYMWDEYGRCRWNLRRGVPPDAVGTFENPFHDGMGSPIRSEIWACLFPGDADSAAHYAALDASLDHGREGIAGEVFFAAMQSSVAAGHSLDRAISLAAGYLPTACETAKAIEQARSAFRRGMPAWDCRDELLARHGSENFTHAPLNVALTIWALLYGRESFEESILLAANGGYDTDCTAATVGATLGLLHGTEGVPGHWSAPIGDEIFVGPGILGINAPRTIDELSVRVAEAGGKLAPHAWSAAAWNAHPAHVRVESLPGTISLQPLDGSAPVAWANGSLPAQVRQAGGAEWTWETSSGQRRELVCLSRAGARVYLDGHLLLECPAGLPFVPAPHRCPEGSRISVTASASRHRIRVELGSRDVRNDAEVILTYRNFHLSPWTREELPHPARLD